MNGVSSFQKIYIQGPQNHYLLDFQRSICKIGYSNILLLCRMLSFELPLALKVEILYNVLHREEDKDGCDQEILKRLHQAMKVSNETNFNER